MARGGVRAKAELQQSEILAEGSKQNGWLAKCSVVSFGTTGYHVLRTRRGRRIATPMDFLSHINLGEMLGDLTVTAFLILLPASVVVVSTMVLFPLIDLAFEKKIEPRHYDELTAHDESWRAGRPWLLLRANFLQTLMSGLPRVQRGHLTLVHDSDQFSESRHRTSLIKRRKTAIQEEARPNRASTPSNAA